MADPFREPETSGLALPATTESANSQVLTSKRAKIDEKDESGANLRTALAIRPVTTIGQLCS